MIKKLLLLSLILIISNRTTYASEPIISAVEHLTDDQIVQQLIVAGCKETAVKELIKAIDASLEARNNSDDEEQEEREWRSSVIKYGLIAAVGVVGIVWFVQIYKNRQHNQQQNQQSAVAAPHIQQASVAASQAPQQPGQASAVLPAGQVPVVLSAVGAGEVPALNFRITGANNLAPEQIAQAQVLFYREFAVDDNEGRSFDVVRQAFPDTQFDMEYFHIRRVQTPGAFLFGGAAGGYDRIGSWNEYGATYEAIELVSAQ